MLRSFGISWANGSVIHVVAAQQLLLFSDKQVKVATILEIQISTLEEVVNSIKCSWWKKGDEFYCYSQQGRTLFILGRELFLVEHQSTLRSLHM